jgi:hypothetical protein
MYGITETTVHVTYRRMRAADACGSGRSVIGDPLPDLRIELLGPDGRPVAPGEAGEIYVGGAGVSAGYLGRAELTGKRFLHDSTGSGSGKRIYRSGDLGRRHPDGELEYLGRADAQGSCAGSASSSARSRRSPRRARRAGRRGLAWPRPRVALDWLRTSRRGNFEARSPTLRDYLCHVCRSTCSRRPTSQSGHPENGELTRSIARRSPSRRNRSAARNRGRGSAGRNRAASRRDLARAAGSGGRPS